MENQAKPPAMDVVAPVPASAEPAKPAPDEAEPKAKKPVTQASKLKPAKESSHVVAAIVATVLIVLGLGLMAVFAYLKQTNSI